MSESKTSWPSYYLREYINNMAGMLKGVISIDLVSEGEIKMHFNDDPTRQALFELFGDITRGIRLTYIIEKEST